MDNKSKRPIALCTIHELHILILSWNDADNECYENIMVKGAKLMLKCNIFSLSHNISTNLDTYHSDFLLVPVFSEFHISRQGLCYYNPMIDWLI